MFNLCFHHQEGFEALATLIGDLLSKETLRGYQVFVLQFYHLLKIFGTPEFCHFSIENHWLISHNQTDMSGNELHRPG